MRIAQGAAWVSAALLLGVFAPAAQAGDLDADRIAAFGQAIDGRDIEALRQLVPEHVAFLAKTEDSRLRFKVARQLWTVARSLDDFGRASDIAFNAVTALENADLIWPFVELDLPVTLRSMAPHEQRAWDAVNALRPAAAPPRLVILLKESRGTDLTLKLFSLLGAYGPKTEHSATILDAVLPWAVEASRADADSMSEWERRFLEAISKTLHDLTGLPYDLARFADLWLDSGMDGAAFLADPDVLSEQAGSSNDDVCLDALDLLERGAWTHAALRPRLESAVSRKDWRITAMALRCIAQLDIAEPPPAAAFKRCERHKYWQVRLALAEALLAYRAYEAVDALIRLLGDDRVRIRDAAHRSLVSLVQQDAGGTQAKWEEWRKTRGRELTFVPRDQRPEDVVQTTRYSDGDADVTRGGFFGKRILSDHVVFALDKSESMYWGQFDQVVEEVRGFVETSPPSTLFAVIEYAGTHSVWKRKLSPANASNARRVINFLKQSDPYGPTNVIGPMRAALEIKQADSIVLLSDGMPNRGAPKEPDEIVRAFSKANRHTRLAVHTLLVETGRRFRHDDPRGDDRPPFTERELKKFEARRKVAHRASTGRFLYELARANDGTFDVVFADYYARDPSAGGTSGPSSDK